MKINEEAIDHFFEPWKYPNEFGIREVKEEEIEVLSYLGGGKKGSTRKAKWDGRIIAFKSWYENSSYSNDCAYSHWELSCYNALKAVQGSLVPKLYFVPRSEKTGKLMFGLELGEEASSYDSGYEEAKNELGDALKKEGWIQRDGSFRPDNLVWMKNEGESKRLVAIDLESFIPYFGPNRRKNKRKIESFPFDAERFTIFGLPQICPSKLQLHNCDET
mmetsp:Transcript_425/g.510  ORF Transcript_425/g.510 Transcript_425/m.510 type:complete len:218 (+) Transcript_425:348-1001(+)